jgi:hypothetical protein
MSCSRVSQPESMRRRSNNDDSMSSIFDLFEPCVPSEIEGCPSGSYVDTFQYCHDPNTVSKCIVPRSFLSQPNVTPTCADVADFESVSSPPSSDSSQSSEASNESVDVQPSSRRENSVRELVTSPLVDSAPLQDTQSDHSNDSSGDDGDDDADGDYVDEPSSRRRTVSSRQRKRPASSRNPPSGGQSSAGSDSLSGVTSNRKRKTSSEVSCRATEYLPLG